MPIPAGSRYEGVNLVVIATKERTRVLMEDREPITIDDLDSEPLRHSVQIGDEISSLAKRFGGKEKLWWIIADINELEFPYELEPGTTILIPSQEFFARFI